MKHISAIPFILGATAAALYLQQAGFFNIKGIGPNFLLIVFVATIVRSTHWTPLIVGLAGLVVFTAVIQPFWIVSFLVFAGIALIARAVKGLLTGNATADFFILLILGSLAQFGTLLIGNSSTFPLPAIIGNLVYTVCLGAIVWIGIACYGKKTDSI
jgi:hypothetical protein